MMHYVQEMVNVLAESQALHIALTHEPTNDKID